jgi:large subunit ribosomal protein L19
MNKLDSFNKKQLKKDLPEIRPGYVVKVHQKIKEKDKQRIQSFEGLVIARKHGKGINATITVRRVASGVGVERIFPIHAPFIENIEVVKKYKVRRAKLYYIRDKSAKQARLKEITPKQKTETKKQ